ncbi:hypothetical protein QFZ80_004772 [Paenibacillus sp. V4I7]|nr:hypothetical protein [Paenibacillus sp. V4I7]
MASVTGLGLFSSSIAKSAIIEQMKQQFYIDLSNQLLNNSSFTENLFQITNAGIGADELQRRSSEIRGLLDQLALSDQSIRDITLFPLEDPIPPISTERESFDTKVTQSGWLEEIRSADGKPVWLSIEERGYLGNSPKPLFAYGRLLDKNNVGSHDFILLVQMDSKVLQSMVSALKLNDGAETLITTKSGKPIMSNRQEFILHELTFPLGQATSGVGRQLDRTVVL